MPTNTDQPAKCIRNDQLGPVELASVPRFLVCEVIYEVRAHFIVPVIGSDGRVPVQPRSQCRDALFVDGSLPGDHSAVPE